ncbi:CoA transferase subunit A [Sphingobium subterraneum]|uniref:Glutaconate CoA-transferase subunit A n=1 Tax=Sphingobium subterraneum TaxID=627688 RepID=A0A841J0B7_9SPHN|nr:CoA transferase subunit A [Sphingobium subterraneum]MBB6122966.1 glutaconate CoA-transferase subunit A [Sphingobium subterraneum]
MVDKPVLSMRELVERFVPDGQELMIGGFAFSDPTALAHELIRQNRRELYVMKTSGGVLVDMLVGAGLIRRLLSCHVWNSVGPVPAHCFRRSLEGKGGAPFEIEELSYGAFTMGLLAGACDLPFAPTTPLLGTGHFETRTFLPDKLGQVMNPFGSEPVSVVAPIKPELGVFHVHRVDALGNAQMFGPTGEMRYAMAACKRLIVIAEELVDTEVIRARPEATVVPSFMVEAIVVEPWAAHPTDSYGYYLRDLPHNELYGSLSRTPEGFAQYVDEWITQTGNHSGFLAKLGEAELDRLRLRREQW